MRGRAAEAVREPHPQVRLLLDVEQTRHRPPRSQIFLERDQVECLGLRLRGGDADPGLAAAPDELHVRVGGQRAVQRGKGIAHLATDPGHVLLRREGQLELGVVVLSPHLEVSGQVLVGIAVTVGAGHPDPLAAELVTQRLERADLVGDAVDAGDALAGVHDGVLPAGGNDSVDRHGLVGRVAALAGGGVPLEQLQGADDGAVGLVAGAEVERSQDGRHHAPVVAPVRVPDHRLDLLAVGRAARLCLLHQGEQGVLADYRVDHLAHAVIRVGQRRLRHPEEDPGLAGHPAEVVEEFGLHPLLRLRANSVDGRDQQVDELIHDLLLAEPAERGQEGEAERLRVAAQLERLLHSGPVAKALEHGGRGIAEEVFGEGDGADHLELGDVFLNAPQPCPSGIRCDVVQRGQPRLVQRRHARERLQQGIERGAARGRQLSQRRRAETGFVVVDQRTEGAVELIGGWGLDAQFPVPLARDLTHALERALSRQDVVAEPGYDRARVGRGRLPKPE